MIVFEQQKLSNIFVRAEKLNKFRILFIKLPIKKPTSLEIFVDVFSACVINLQ